MKRGKEEKKKKKKNKKKRRKVWIYDFVYGDYFCMDSSIGCYDDFVWNTMGVVWIISRVYLGIHPNPRFVESWVGKTLICRR